MDNYDNPKTTSNVTGSGLGAITPRESEMARVLNKLHSVVEIAVKSFSELDIKLTPILRSDVPKETNDKATPGYSSQLAQEVNTACEKIDNLIRYIQSVRSRVEL